MQKFQKEFRLLKVDEKEHIAYGIATSEAPDKVNEICDYAATKPFYQAWSLEAYKSTIAAGQSPSLGNVRLMHETKIFGKVIKIDFDDDAKQVLIGVQPMNDESWAMVTGGFVRGFSQGGDYIWRRCNICATDVPEGAVCSKCKKTVAIRYAASPAEVSAVDNPCLEEATFQYVKTNGSMELRKFVRPAEPAKEIMAKTAGKTVKVRSVYVEKAAAALGLEKSMYQVGEMAYLLQSLAYVRDTSLFEAQYEDDASDIELAEKLEGNIVALVETFKDLVENETSELTGKIEKTAKAALTKGDSKMDEDLKKSFAVLAEGVTELVKRAKKEDAEKEDAAKAKADEEKAAKAAKAKKAKCPDCGETHDADEKCADKSDKAAKPDATLPAAAPATKGEMVTMSKADLEAALEKAHDTAFVSVLEALKKGAEDEDEDDDDAKKAKAKKEKADADKAQKSVKLSEMTLGDIEGVLEKMISAKVGTPAPTVSKGVGDRTEMSSTLAKSSPFITVMPYAKKGGESAENQSVSADVVMKAAQGDRASVLKMFEGVQAQTEVPATLVEAVSKLK